MKLKRSQIIWAVFALVVGGIWVYGFWMTEVFHTHKANEIHRKALSQMHETIALNASYSDVLSVYWKMRTESLRLFADRESDWVVAMPLELFASDWKLRIQFVEGKVVAVQIHTSDGAPPADGPKDKIKVDK